MIFRTNSLFLCYLGNWRSWHRWTLPAKVPDWDNQHHPEEWAIVAANIFYLLLVYPIMNRDAFTRFLSSTWFKSLYTAQILTSCRKVLAAVFFYCMLITWSDFHFDTSSSHITGGYRNCLCTHSISFENLQLVGHNKEALFFCEWVLVNAFALELCNLNTEGKHRSYVCC